MERRTIPSGSPYEPIIGFSRAVVDGHHVAVSGTAPVMPDGAPPPAGAEAQAARCIEILLEALARVGLGPENVIRTRSYLVRAEDWEAVGRAHGAAFGSSRPASTMVVVAGLLDPRWLVEIEADAVLPEPPA